MTVTIKQEKIKNYHIEIAQDKYSTVYRVILSHTYDGELYRVDKENHYATLTAANRRYNYLKKGIQA